MLAGAIVIGPRLGKYKGGKDLSIPGHHIPMAVVGTFILACGWFGFNAGSSIIKPFKPDEVKDALSEIGIHG